MKYTPDFSSRFRILKGGKISLVVSALVAGSTMSFASPTGGTVTSGSATINQNGSVTTINQSTNKASINWNSFSIAPSETVNFVQPSSQSVTLNRVIGATPSLIQGAMNANGQVFLLNPNGVLFANGSQINVGGLVASTLNITDQNFQNGNYVFEGNSQNSVLNMGTITTAQGGYVAMMGKTVQNEGTIVATMSNVQLAGGDKISLNLNGNSLVKLTIDKGTLNALIENKGLIKADGGQVYLTTQALNTILDSMVNNTGVIEAQTLNDVTGKVVLFAHGGTANVAGEIKADGGFVETSGKNVKIADDFIVKAKEWLIDPTDFVIINSADPLTTSGIGASTLSSILSQGTSVTIATDAADSGSELGDIIIFESITKTGGSDATLTLKAHGSIALFNNKYIFSNAGKLNVVLWADTDNSGSGTVYLGSGSAIATNGGHVAISGGDTGTVWVDHALTIGSGFTKSDDNFYGVNIQGSINTSDGSNDFSHYGDVLIKGATNSSIARKGVALYNGAEIIGNNVFITAMSSTGDGLYVEDGRIEAYGINIQAAGGDGGSGFASASSNNEFIAKNLGMMIQGIANGTGHGINANGTFTSAGGIYMTGISANGNGFYGGLYDLTINDTSDGGQVWIYGSSTNGTGLYIDNGGSVNFSTSTTGTMSLMGFGHVYGHGVDINNENATFTAGYGTVMDDSYGTATGHTGLWIKGSVGDSAEDIGDGVRLKGNYYAVGGEVSVIGNGGVGGGDGIMLGTGLIGHQASDGKDTLGVFLDGTANVISGDGAGIYTNSSTGTMTITTLNNGYVKILGHGSGNGYGVDFNNEDFKIYAGNGMIPGLTDYSLYMNAAGGTTGSGARIAGSIESGGDALLSGSAGGGSAFEVVGGSIYADGALSITGNAQSAAGDANGVVLNDASVTGDTGTLTLTGKGHGDGYGYGYGIYFKDSSSSISANNGSIMLDGSGQTGAGYSIFQDTSVALSADASIQLKGNGGSIWLGDENNEIDSQYGVASNIGTKAVDFTLVSGNNDLKLGRIDTTGKINIYTVNEGPITLRSDITTTSTSDDAIVINAGRTIPAGTITNPSDDEVNIVVEDGSPVEFITGNGGTVKLYTGSIANSTGIGAMATSSDYKLYNSDKDTDLSDYLNEFGAGKYVIYREINIGGNQGGGDQSGDSTPTPTTNTGVQNQVNNVVTTIVNSTTVTPPAPTVVSPVAPQPSVAQTQATQLLQTIMPQSNRGEHFNLVGMTDGLTPVQTVNMEQLQSASGGQGIHEIRVPLGHDSIVELINGGVNLPKGLSQEFYVIADNTQQDNK